MSAVVDALGLVLCGACALLTERARDHEYDIARGRVKNVGPTENEIKEPGEQPQRPTKTEYDLRQAWLSDMNVLWFKGEREWQDRWLKEPAAVA